MACFGALRPLTEEEVANSPSRADGISADEERRLRSETAYFMHTVGEKGFELAVGQRGRLGIFAILTGMLYFQLFFTRRSFAKYDRWEMGLACLFLASKVHEARKSVNHIIDAFFALVRAVPGYAKATGRTGKLPGRDDEEYEKLRERIYELEFELLIVSEFNFKVEHPHKYLGTWLNELLGPKYMCLPPEKVTRLVEGELAKTAWYFSNDSLRTTLPLRYSPELIALAAIQLTLRQNRDKFKLERRIATPLPREGMPWYEELYAKLGAKPEVINAIQKELVAAIPRAEKEGHKRSQQAPRGAVSSSNSGAGSRTRNGNTAALAPAPAPVSAPSPAVHAAAPAPSPAPAGVPAAVSYSVPGLSGDISLLPSPAALIGKKRKRSSRSRSPSALAAGAASKDGQGLPAGPVPGPGASRGHERHGHRSGAPPSRPPSSASADGPVHGQRRHHRPSQGPGAGAGAGSSESLPSWDKSTLREARKRRAAKSGSSDRSSSAASSQPARPPASAVVPAPVQAPVPRLPQPSPEEGEILEDGEIDEGSASFSSQSQSQDGDVAMTPASQPSQSSQSQSSSSQSSSDGQTEGTGVPVASAPGAPLHANGTRLEVKMAEYGAAPAGSASSVPVVTLAPAPGHILPSSSAIPVPPPASSSSAPLTSLPSGSAAGAPSVATTAPAPSTVPFCSPALTPSRGTSGPSASHLFSRSPAMATPGPLISVFSEAESASGPGPGPSNPPQPMPALNGIHHRRNSGGDGSFGREGSGAAGLTVGATPERFAAGGMSPFPGAPHVGHARARVAGIESALDSMLADMSSIQMQQQQQTCAVAAAGERFGLADGVAPMEEEEGQVQPDEF